MLIGTTPTFIISLAQCSVFLTILNIKIYIIHEIDKMHQCACRLWFRLLIQCTYIDYVYVLPFSLDIDELAKNCSLMGFILVKRGSFPDWRNQWFLKVVNFGWKLNLSYVKYIKSKVTHSLYTCMKGFFCQKWLPVEKSMMGVLHQTTRSCLQIFNSYLFWNLLSCYILTLENTSWQFVKVTLSRKLIYRKPYRKWPSPQYT